MTSVQMERYARFDMGLRLSTAILVLALSGCTSSISQVEANRALTPIRSVPLAAARPAGQVSFTEHIPGGPEWRKLTTAWGVPDFVVAVASPDQQTLLCFDRLHLNVHLRVNSKAVPVESAHWLYGYSLKCQDIGLKFRAEAGDQLDVTVDVPAAASAEADNLILVPDWGPKTKDRLVGVGISDDVPGFLKRIL
jgi:hypothetical protein